MLCFFAAGPLLLMKGASERASSVLVHSDCGGGTWGGNQPQRTAGFASVAALKEHAFAHEIAHMFGADHDRETLAQENDGKGSQPMVPYGIGNKIPNTDKATIMA